MTSLLQQIAPGWLPPAETPPDREDGYDRHRRRMADRTRSASANARDIGEIPDVENPRRRKRCVANLQEWCETYHASTFDLAWSPDHIRVIERIQKAIHEGGQFALAMPRGSGKTSLCEVACLYALLGGRRRYVALIGAEKTHALEMLDSIRTELETNDLLLADFPEVCYPISRLEGVSQRRLLYRGEPIKMRLRGDKIILPWIPGSKAAGGVLHVAGLTGRIRGMKHKLPGGEPLRPDFAVVDDPQTDESARSDEQSEYRESIVSGAVLGLAGPKTRIAAVMPCTIIKQRDMAYRILDRQTHPEWNGEKTQLVYKFPENAKLWDEYAQIRADGLRNGDDGAAGNAFYRTHRKEMDAGAEVAWPERKPGAISALQFAMNLRYDNEQAFFAEFQNDPIDESPPDDDLLTPDQILRKINRVPRGRVPLEGSHLVGFLDVGKTLVYYAVCAFSDDFTGSVVDYGTLPDQNRLRFRKREPGKPLAALFPGRQTEGVVYAGLEETCRLLLEREWKRADGNALRIERLLIDANWGECTDVVYQFCRQSQYAANVAPSHGRFYGASMQPMSEYSRKPGDRIGLNWRIPANRGKRATRYVLFDANYWKSFVHARLSTAMGDRGSLSLFGDKPFVHSLFADHMHAEYRDRVYSERTGRTVDEWKQRPTRPDNDWFDCLAGCCVAASIAGCALTSGDVALTGDGKGPRRERMKLSDRQKGRRP